ncbi:MAG: trigger factor [Bacillota bacterium]|jgi:trigger factor
MKVEVQNLEQSKVQLQVEIDAAQVAEALEHAYRKVVRQIVMPGFRRGKAPRALIEARYGVEVFYDDAIDFLLPKAYEYALEESKVEAIDQPEVEVVTFESEQPAVFRFTVPTPPEVTLGQYKGVEVEKASFPISDADVQAELEKLQEQHARLVDSPEETVQEGDYVTLDYAGSVDGEAFEGGQASDYTLQIGSGTFIPGFEEQLVGLAREAETAINVTFPEDYRAEHLAGKAAVFEIKIKDIKRRVVPDLDDDFAAEISEHATLEELQADVENKLAEAARQQERNLLESRVVKAVVANAELDLPDVMVEREVEEMVRELSYNLARQGFPPEFAREYIENQLDKIKADYRDMAADRVKTRLVLAKVAEVEGVSASDDELEQKLQEMAELYQQDPAELRNSLEAAGSLDEIRNSIVVEKTVNMLVDSAQLTEPKTEAAEDESNNPEASEAE